MLPFVWLHRIKKKGENKQLQALTELAAKYDGALSKYDVLSDFAVGIDENKGCVFFYKKTKEVEVSEFIDLASIKTCKVANSQLSFNTHDGVRRMIEKLELSFVPVADNKPPIVLEFYDMHKNVQLVGELQLIEQWANRINERLKQSK